SERVDSTRAFVASAISAAVAAAFSMSISPIRTEAPASASRKAVARPSPQAAPVTTALRPFSEIRSASELAETSRTAMSGQLREVGIDGVERLGSELIGRKGLDRAQSHAFGHRDLRIAAHARKMLFQHNLGRLVAEYVANATG